MLEPIQHESGVQLPPADYLGEVRKICDEKEIILIFDEIMTGFGKTGRMFACEHFNVIPDILVFGKGAGGGLVPTGGLVAKKSLWRKFGLSFPMSATSFAWNALTCSALLSTIEVFQNERLLDQCMEKGALLFDNLSEVCQGAKSDIKAVQGIGLMVSVECTTPAMAMKVIKGMVERKVLIGTAWANTKILMFEPPLVINNDQIQAVTDEFAGTLKCMYTDR